MDQIETQTILVHCAMHGPCLNKLKMETFMAVFNAQFLRCHFSTIAVCVSTNDSLVCNNIHTLTRFSAGL